MRHLIILLFVTLFSGQLKAETVEVNMLWDKANTAYINAKYDEAITLYDSISDMGYSSHKLYFNMGNAYFKIDELGAAMLYYTRAEHLLPSDVDTRHNLAVASNYVKDKIEAVPQFFLTRLFAEVRGGASSNFWAIFSIISLLVMFAFVLMYLLSNRLGVKKIGFFTALFMFVIFIVTTLWSLTERSEIVDSRLAIIMNESIAVKSSPDNSSKDLFILHEGTKVTIRSSLNGWVEIEIADGNKGWLLNSSIETVY